MLEQVKTVFSKPMSTGDSTLMMLLSLNLLLLVFFMMLNSMATYGAKHAEDVLAQVRQGYSVQVPVTKATDDVPEVPFAPWRSALGRRIDGLLLNRIDLRVLPQQGNAAKVEIEMPMGAVFDGDGKVAHPELVRNMAAAAGEESDVVWQVAGDWTKAERLSRRAAALTAYTGHVQVVAAKAEVLRVVITPGTGTKSGMGLQVQGVGENVGGAVKGVEETR